MTFPRPAAVALAALLAPTAGHAIDCDDVGSRDKQAGTLRVVFENRSSNWVQWMERDNQSNFVIVGPGQKVSGDDDIAKDDTNADDGWSETVVKYNFKHGQKVGSNFVTTDASRIFAPDITVRNRKWKKSGNIKRRTEIEETARADGANYRDAFEISCKHDFKTSGENRWVFTYVLEDG